MTGSGFTDYDRIVTPMLDLRVFHSAIVMHDTSDDLILIHRYYRRLP